MFYVGQKVVCVDARIHVEGRSWGGDPPVEGQEYTVTGVVTLNDPAWPDPVSALHLAEISNSKIWDGAYGARRFRRVVERKTDISVFTEMLKPIRVNEPAH